MSKVLDVKNHLGLGRAMAKPRTRTLWFVTLAKGEGPEGKKIRLRKGRRDQEREGAKRPSFFLKRSARESVQVRELSILDGRCSKAAWGRPSKESKRRFLNSLQ